MSSSSSPLSSPEFQRRQFASLPSRSFVQLAGKGKTFLDEHSFRYKAEVIKYFEGAQTLPASNSQEFLDVLGAVLVATETDLFEDSDPVKGEVRQKFLELYHANSHALELVEHAAHKMVGELWGERDYSTFESSGYRAPFSMKGQIECYLSELGSEVIDKYLDERAPANPCDHPDEFYELYVAILQDCPKAPELSLSQSSAVVHSPAEELRARFDRLFEGNQQGLKKCWHETDYARHIEQLRSMPFTSSFRAPPSAHYRSGGGFPSDFSFSPSPHPMEFRIMYRTEDFESLQSRLGPFDFEGHGLEDISARIIEFYQAVPNTHPDQGTRGFSSGSASSFATRFPVGEKDLFPVLKRVLTQLKGVDVELLAEETIDMAFKSRFIQLFEYAAATPERQGGLSDSQTSEINALLGRANRRSRVGFVGLSTSSSSFDSREGGIRRRARKAPSSGGGSGGSPIVKGALLLLALYLGYRFVAKPTYQWIRGNKTTPVGE
ncbi:MAG: hypothetical protein KFB93_00020 [Simkaniaceae bacterium]|nr:MAG: hypothetical protein KFB93_00020 [Simkaniaceae bacterium]